MPALQRPQLDPLPPSPPALPPHLVARFPEQKAQPEKGWRRFLRRVRRLWGMLKGKDIALLGGAVLALLGSAALALLSPIMLGSVMDSLGSAAVGGGPSLSDLLTPLLIFLGRFVLHGAGTMALNVSTESMACSVRQQLLSHILQADLAFFDSSRTGQIVDRIGSDVREMREVLRAALGEGLPSISRIIGGAAGLWYLSPELSTAAAVALPFVFAAGNAFAARLRKLSRESSSAQAAAAGAAQESLSNIRTVKAFNGEAQEAERYRRKAAHASSLASSLHAQISLFHASSALTLWGLGAATWAYGSSLVSAGNLSPASLKSFLMLAVNLEQSLESLSITGSKLVRAQGAWDGIFSLLEVQTEGSSRSCSGGSEPGRGYQWQQVKGEVVLDNVSFSYPTAPGNAVLSGLSLTIPAGQCIAITGPTGSGKSTIVSLLLGFFKPNLKGEGEVMEGAEVVALPAGGAEQWEAVSKPSSLGLPPTLAQLQSKEQEEPLWARKRALPSSDASPSSIGAPPPGMIRLDGIPLPFVDLKWLRSQIAYVPQEPVLWSASVRENMLLARPDASEEEIEAALKAAAAWEFVQQLPQGLDTVLSERGGSLSGGQRQRISIARAFLQTARVVEKEVEVEVQVEETVEETEELEVEVEVEGGEQGAAAAGTELLEGAKELQHPLGTASEESASAPAVLPSAPPAEPGMLAPSAPPAEPGMMAESAESAPSHAHAATVTGAASSGAASVAAASGAASVTAAAAGASTGAVVVPLPDPSLPPLSLPSDPSKQQQQEEEKKKEKKKEMRKELRKVTTHRTVSRPELRRVVQKEVLFDRCPILILDEITSAQSETSAKAVEEALLQLRQGTAGRGPRTTILIAHRLNSMAAADMVAVLQDGKVAELGAFNQLASKKGGLLAELVEASQVQGPLQGTNQQQQKQQEEEEQRKVLDEGRKEKGKEKSKWW